MFLLPSKEAGSAEYHIAGENGAKGIINLIHDGTDVSEPLSGFGVADPLNPGTGNYIFVRYTSPVDIDSDSTVVAEIDNYFSTTADPDPVAVDRRRENSIRPCQTYQSCTSVTAATINNILASTIEIESSVNNSEIDVGDTFSNNLNTTFGDFINRDNPTRIKAVLNKGFLRVGQDVTDSNPYDSTTASSIDAITFTPNFYLKKETYSEVPFNLDKGSSTASVFLAPQNPPPGMTFVDDGILKGKVSEKMTSTIYDASRL